MEYLIDYIQDEYLYEYMESLLADPKIDRTILNEVFETWGFPIEILDKIMPNKIENKDNKEVTPYYALNSIKNVKNTDFVHKKSFLPLDLKKPILEKYDLRPINDKPYNPIIINNDNKTSKIRYHNNIIVSNKGEKYIDLSKKS